MSRIPRKNNRKTHQNKRAKSSRTGDAPGDRLPFFNRHILPPLLICAVGFLAYGNSYDGVLILDDIPNIHNNTSIRSLSDIGQCIVATPRPTVNVTLAINYALEKLDTLKGYHLVNVLIHISAALLLFGVLRRTIERMVTDGRNIPFSATGIALTTTAIWVAHPLQTQSVTYLIQRSEALMGMFYLLTFYCVIRGITAQQKRIYWYAAAIISCALGMGSKAVMVTAPVMLFLFDSTFFAASFRETLNRRWKLYLGLASTWAVLIACGVVGKVLLGKGEGDVGAGFAVQAFSPIQYAWTQPGVILHYIRLAIWPHPLCLDYDWSVASGIIGAGIPGIIILTAILATLGALFWRRSWTGYAGAWFFGVLLPTSSFVPIKDIAYEHRMYLSLAGVVILCVGLAAWTLKRFAPPRRRTTIAWGLSALLVSGGIWQTRQRNKDYHCTIAIWESVVSVRPDNTRAWNNLGNAYLEAGDTTNASQAYKAAIKLDPTNPTSYLNMGVIMEHRGDMENAAAQYETALSLDPTSAMAHANLGNALMNLKRTAEAEDHYRQALDLDPDHVLARYALGRALMRRQAWADAEHQFREALRLENMYDEARLRLANVLARQNRLDEAIDEYRRCIESDPNYAPVRYRLGIALHRAGQIEAAATEFHQTLRINPQHERAKAALNQLESRR